MSVSISGGCSHTVDPDTHEVVRDGYLSIDIHLPRLGLSVDLDIRTHSESGSHSLSESIDISLGGISIDRDVSLSLPSSVSGGSALGSLSGLVGHTVAQLGHTLGAVGGALHDSSHSSGGSSTLDLQDGTLISLPHWHH